MWGADSYEWRPERWFEGVGNPKSPVGAYGNLCVVFLIGLWSTADAPTELPSPEELGLASGGDSRSYFHVHPLTFRDSIPFTRVFEMHAFLVTLVKQFEFDLPDGAPRVRRWRDTGLVIPVVEGQEHEGTQLPLKVTPVKTK